MALKSLILELDAGAAEALADACLEAGALAASTDDPLAGTEQEIALYDEPGAPAAGAPAAWARVRLNVLLDAATASDAFMAEASRAAGLPAAPAFREEAVPDDDWVRKTQAQFPPIRISPRLWITPSWHAAPDPAAINIMLDPGAAFGTGSHPTTRLCLQWLEQSVRGGESVLDYGCGSGILAIAAARLGAARVMGVDIDPTAVQAARDNAARNAVDAQFFDGAAAPETVADVLVANILSNPLKLLAPLLARRVRPGGRLALSGVLAAQAEDVMQVYRPWFEFAAPKESEGWVCLSGRRT